MKQILLEIVEKYPYHFSIKVRKEYPNFYKDLSKGKGTFSKNLYDYLYKNQKCKTCDKESKFNTFHKGYRLYCSEKCRKADSKAIVAKSRQTIFNMYGVDNISQLEVVKEKKKETLRKNYGVEHQMHSPIVKQKLKKTNMEKYGVENPFANEEIKEKIKQHNFNLYGVEYNTQVPELIEKQKKTFSRTYKSRGLEIREQRRKSCLKKYGVTHHLKNYKIKTKLIQTNVNKGRWLPRHLKPAFQLYKEIVQIYTEREWTDNYYRINSLNRVRGYDYHLDHIFSIVDGFVNNIPPYIIGNWTNLQILSAFENMSKGTRSDKIKEQLFEDYERRE